MLYRRWAEPTDVRRRLEPYGLVLKAGRWYVVAGPGPRTYRVDQILRILEPDASEEEFTRPDGFDLAAYWTAYQRDFHARLHRGEALVRLAPGVTLPRAVPVEESTGDGGWTTVSVPIESVERAHGSSCGWAPTSRCWNRPSCAEGSPGPSPNWPKGTATWPGPAATYRAEPVRPFWRFVTCSTRTRIRAGTTDVEPCARW